MQNSEQQTSLPINSLPHIGWKATEWIASLALKLKGRMTYFEVTFVHCDGGKTFRIVLSNALRQGPTEFSILFWILSMHLNRGLLSIYKVCAFLEKMFHLGRKLSLFSKRSSSSPELNFLSWGLKETLQYLEAKDSRDRSSHFCLIWKQPCPLVEEKSVVIASSH